MENYCPIVMYPPQKCKPNELSLKVANETSGVRRLTVPSGQTVTLYCPKTSFENYQGLWERHFHLRTSNLEPMFFYQIFHDGIYKKTIRVLMMFRSQPDPSDVQREQRNRLS